MIQLKLFKTKGDPDSAIFIDLYDTEPIKLTLSIEDITTADASSVFSKTFRVPATRNNNEFFKNAFEIDGIDYDVTIKKPAEILVDGAEFKSGHIRLQKIFTNTDKDRIDYELLFLGETRDFSSVIADRTMCTLEMTDFAWEGLPVNYTNATDFVGPFGFNDIVQSWNAWDGTTGTLTSGFADGDLLFPLIDHGNTYDDGDPLQGTIALGATGAGIRSFTHMANSLDLTRLKPMIRGKRVWDQIFQDAGYTYSSDFLNSDIFHQMYLSAFGNNEQIGMEIGQTTTTIFSSYNTGGFGNDVEDYMYNFNVTGNVSGSYNTGSTNTGSYFVAPGTATLGGNYYIMSASAEVDARRENSDYSDSPVLSAVQIVVVNNLGGTPLHVLATGNYTSGNNTTSVTWDSRNGGYQPVTGDIIQVFINASSGTIDNSSAQNTFWNCTAAPGEYYAPLDLDCEYKQIDYIKDILTMFRLVMQPDSNRPNNFIIEPWQEFIGSGTTYDWSDKLVQNKDVQLEPLFNTQSQDIEFTFEEDDDLINKFHQDNNKHAYGWLRFTSNNELLKGKRDIKVTGIAPTPIDQIASAAAGVHPAPDFILPTIIEVTGENFERLPIKPKSRFLFYNGKQDITVPQDEWYLNANDGSPTVQDQWPLVSPYSDWPVQGSSLNLNFSNDTRYYLNPVPGTGYFEQGSTLYDAYWSRYINSLYNKFSRRLTANFTLNNVDLQQFAFNDVIFVNGKYFRPEKIIDVQIGETTEVQVQLITLKDQRPIWLNEPLTGFSVATFNNNCAGAQGSIQITTNGTPNFTWELVDSGAQGVHNAPTGQAPYTFTIDAPVGTDTLMVTDSLGRTAEIQVNVPASTTTPITTTYDAYNPTICSDDEEQCDGAIIVSVNGAAQPAVTYWIGEPTQSGNTRVQLCEGTYQYYVVDANGCESDVTIVELVCEGPTPTAWKVQSCIQPEDPTHPNATRYVTLDPSQIPPAPLTQLAPGMVLDDGDDADVYGRCFEVIALEYTEVPNFNYIAVYDDCATCATGGTYTYEYELCSDPTTIGIASTTLNNWAFGTVVKLTNGICVVLRSPSTLPPDFVIDDTQAYIDCDACNGITPSEQVCHNIENPQILGPASGTYEFDGQLYDWSVGSGQTIALCAVTGSIVVLSGSPNIELTDSICTSPRECTIPVTAPTYVVLDCTSSLQWTMEKQNSNFFIGDVIQFRTGVPGTGAVYCGTITNINNGTPDATLYNVFTSYDCGDAIHCLQ